jgi:hypothetical protein
MSLLIRYFVIIIAFLLISACSGSSEIPAEKKTRIKTIGQDASKKLVSTLGGLLKAAMQNGGAGAAVDFCSEKAQAVTIDVQSTLAGGVKIRRISNRYRNPLNRPTSEDLAAIKVFETGKSGSGEYPPEYIVRALEEDAFLYYQPLTIQKLCLNCHGPENTIKPAVKSAILQAYPADMATGYAEGDLRGLVKVTVPAKMLD